MHGQYQAWSQDREPGSILGGAGPPKSRPFEPKKWTFWNLNPLTHLRKPILTHFVAKSF